MEDYLKSTIAAILSINAQKNKSLGPKKPLQGIKDSGSLDTESN